MRRNWILRSANQAAVEIVGRHLSVPPLIARLLVCRGMDAPEKAGDFLCGDLNALGDPARMADLPRAVQLIRRAAEEKQTVWIVGDYDADGITGTAILFRTLRRLGVEPHVHIPHRTQDGYGLRADVVRRAREAGARLLITVDCGTTSFEEMELARSLGMETVVVDHHDLDPSRTLPASALLNPLRPDCSYPEKELASAGVAFTLARALLEEGEAWQHLDLAAIGTIADLAPLTGENRILVKTGLHALRGSTKPGIRALLARAGLEGRSLETDDVAFSLAPPLNAAGRMGSAEDSFRLLVSDDPAESEKAAEALFRQNRARAASGREAFQKALVKISREINFSKDRVIILEDEGWHPGVIGILATRLANRFHRPTVIIAMTGDSCRGSARSIRSFHLVEALHAVREHLVEFGGHPGAAGLTIERSRIPAFREALNQIARERIDPKALSPTVDLDGELPLSELTEELIRGLEMLAPFGSGNPRPVFISTDASLPARGEAPLLAKDGFSPWGIRLQIGDSTGRFFEALHPREFLEGSLNLRRIRGNVHLAYSPVHRRGAAGLTIELRLKDLKLP